MEELESVWRDYASLARDNVRNPSLDLLEIFSNRLSEVSPELQRAWTERVMSREPELMKFPLFQKVGFAVLSEGALKGRPHYARWLASCQTLMTPDMVLRLPENARTEWQLLELALAHDPDDENALNRWVEVQARFIADSLHELPSGVLYDGVRGASAAECDELLDGLESFERKLPAHGRAQHAALILRARFFYQAYKDYRTFPTGRSFGERLADEEWGTVTGKSPFP